MIGNNDRNSSRGGDRDRGDRDGGRGGAGGDDEKRGGGRGFGRKKVCRFCAEKNAKVDFKDQATLKYFVTERGKIIPRRISGNCAKHQREVAVAIKRARGLALLPYNAMVG
ncbi:30S ribosomal protein S18 [Melittangium boletus]|uniref:Small ribosomal subunit protein bS18 n=1 Tax=Melittangium boletus DSM 14713 TaxID=1294270 RepID=A0A250ILR8_9BACT|nr:30S ribosomal protein S18 [Melittangium boletus DSM 14713]